MFDIIKKEIEWNGATLTLETGKIARLSTAAVVASMGGTIVLCTVVGDREAPEHADFLPLTVHYIEKFYAAGRIPGGFLKRESKPSEREVLSSRLIDRAIRPLFPDGYCNAVQVICTVMSYDEVYNPDVLAMIGTSAALSMSEIPFSGTVGAVRVGYQDGHFTFNQPKSEDSLLELVVAGTKDSVLMVESEAKELSKDIVLQALVKGQEALKPVIELIDEFAKACNKTKWSFEAKIDHTLRDSVSKLVEQDLRIAYSEPAKATRSALVKSALKKAKEALSSDTVSERLIASELALVCQKIVRSKILDENVRIDGRRLDEIRSIVCELDLLPKTHGSALFTRGETQALVVTTIGTAQDEQMQDDLLGNRTDNVMLHYNFPPYAVCETSMLRAPGRREIGHGKLAFKAIAAVLPSKEEFPYTIRLVSEITESNGSSSMATVCGSSLSMMAAGIPIKKPVAGIAMGLIKSDNKFAILSDIMGDEDFLGDMDFKVAGTDNGITALQMDIKIDGISKEILEQALNQACTGLNHIASKMAEVINTPRLEMSSNAPRIVSIQIDKEKIREVIGSGGKVIRDICEKSGAKIDIEESGKINVAGVTSESIDIAMQMISDIIAVAELGKIYTGTVTKLASFGAFVKFLGSTEGLLHISEISNERIEQIEDVMKEGDMVEVQVVGMEKNGKVRLSMKSLINGDFESGKYNSDQSSERRSRKPDDRGGKPSKSRSDDQDRSSFGNRSERSKSDSNFRPGSRNESRNDSGFRSDRSSDDRAGGNRSYAKNPGSAGNRTRDAGNKRREDRGNIGSQDESLKRRRFF